MNQIDVTDGPRGNCLVDVESGETMPATKTTTQARNGVAERSSSSVFDGVSGAPPPAPPPPDPKQLLKDDAWYQQLVSDLKQLQAIGFDLLESTFTGLFQSADGKLSEDNCRWAVSAGGKMAADALTLLGNPRLWAEMDQDHDGCVSKDELLGTIRTIIASMVDMEKAATVRALTPVSPAPGAQMDAATAAQSLGPGPESTSDDLFSRDELATYYEMEKASASDGTPGSSSVKAVSPAVAASSAASAASATPASSTSTPGSSSATSSSSSKTASGLEDASKGIGAAREKVEKKISDLSDKFASLDPEKDGVKIAQTERQIQALTNLQTMLAQLEIQLFQMIQNMIKMRHDVAMNAIRHIN